MQVTIYYCNACKLRQPAEQIAAALEREFNLSSELKAGFWGTFKIEVDGEEVFNRWKDRGLIGRLGFGRTPQPEEIVQLFRQRFGFDDPPGNKGGAEGVPSRHTGSPALADAESR